MDDNSHNELAKPLEVSTNTSNLENNSSVNTQLQEKTHVSPVIIILLLIVFTPAAMIFMYREKRYHRWFAYLLWLLAGWQIIFYAIQIFYIVPQVQTLYQDLNMSNTSQNTYTSYIVPLLIVMIEILVGTILFKKVNNELNTYKKLLIITICLLIAGYILGIISSIYSFILPIYNLNYAFN